MNAKVEALYEQVVNQIGDLGATLDRADYRAFIEEIEGHVTILRMGLR